MAVLFVMALPCLCQQPRTIISGEEPENKKEDKELTVSLITAFPGPEIYELCGHSAIRVRGEGIDSVWNFGIFDFNQPNFVYRFVKGETDYKGAAYPFYWFLPDYVERGSRVVEQDLNLTPEETLNVLSNLRKAVLPENATYRYNYVKDNCATRILDRIEESSGETIIYPDTIRYGTFRNEMRSYHNGYPWYQFGIDLALGSGLDSLLSPREEMFVPVEMMKNVGMAKFTDGRPLVKATRILNKGSERSVYPPTPWYAGPLFWSWMVAILTGIVAALDIIKKKITAFYYSLWFTLLALAGMVVAFLVFVSVHEATSPNILIFWLNPLQLLFVLGIIFKPLKILAKIMAWYNVVTSGGLIIASPFLIQSFNPAFYPLLLSSFVLGLCYAIIKNKSSYKRR